MVATHGGDSTVSDRLSGLAWELKELFGRWATDPRPWPEERFREYALRAFELQFAANLPYRRYCESRDTVPGALDDWREIPAAPTAAFRAVDLIVGTPEDALVVFRTSGTSRGREDRGRHLVRDPELYRASLRAGFYQFVLKGEPEPLIISLQQSFNIASDSSLSWMLDDVREAFGGKGSFSAGTPTGLAWRQLEVAVQAAAEEARPVCVLGTTLALAAWLERLAERDVRLALPRHSRVMDTGGAKGTRRLDRRRVADGLLKHLGIPADSFINEFGMTELLSQRYSRGGKSARLLHGPPWLITRALDPVTLEELADGEVGVLCHMDLANLGSVSHVLTEDLGSTRRGAMKYEGRVPGAPPRGCSLATARLLQAQRDG